MVLGVRKVFNLKEFKLGLILIDILSPWDSKLRLRLVIHIGFQPLLTTVTICRPLLFTILKDTCAPGWQNEFIEVTRSNAFKLVGVFLKDDWKLVQFGIKVCVLLLLLLPLLLFSRFFVSRLIFLLFSLATKAESFDAEVDLLERAIEERNEMAQSESDDDTDVDHSNPAADHWIDDVVAEQHQHVENHYCGHFVKGLHVVDKFWIKRLNPLN